MDLTSGFLNDVLRDGIAVVGLILALFQTWLAIKSAPGSTARRRHRPRSSPPTSLKIARISLGVALLLLLAGGWVIAHQIGRPAPTKAERLLLMEAVQRSTFTVVSLWALAYIIGTIALHQLEAKRNEVFEECRLVFALTHGMGVVVTLFAVVAGCWAFTRSVASMAVVAAVSFAVWTNAWTLVAMTVHMGGPVPHRKRVDN